jgi:DNA topoisomerase-1
MTPAATRRMGLVLRTVVVGLLLGLLAAPADTCWAQLKGDQRRAAIDKWQKINAFRPKTGRLRGRARAALQNPHLDRGTATAVAVELMRARGLRVGSRCYSRSKDPSFGATSLRKEHVRVRGDTVYLDFPSKGHRVIGHDARGKPVRVRNTSQLTIKNRDLARAVQLFLEQPGDGALLRIPRRGGGLRALDEGDTTRWVRPLGGKNHNWRHLYSDRLHRALLRGMPRPTSEAQAWDNIKQAADRVAERVGHADRDTTIKHYLDPLRLERYAAPPGQL